MIFTFLGGQHIFRKAAEYVDGTIDLQELEEWLLPNLGNILDAGNENSIALAKLIEGGNRDSSWVIFQKKMSQELKTLLSSSKAVESVRGHI